ncbi:MAG TPA: TRAP transporter small permease subunit [Thiolinea sp.]|nr:TRAP transporter small permease subunit [Thiolinea sp.]
MSLIYRLFDLLTGVMFTISGTLLIAMMLSTLVDIISRLLFGLTEGGVDFTFIGGVELIKYGLLLSILFVLPRALRHSQVVVDLFTDRLPLRIRHIMEGIYLLGYMLLGAGMSYRFWLAAGHAQQNGETTQDLLLPMSWLYFICSFATAVLAVAAVLAAWRLLSGAETEAEDETGPEVAL